MSMPAAPEGAEAGNPLLAQVLQAVLQPQAGQAAAAAGPQEQAPAPRPMIPEPQQPARFDARRFYSLLGLRQ